MSQWNTMIPSADQTASLIYPLLAGDSQMALKHGHFGAPSKSGCKAKGALERSMSYQTTAVNISDITPDQASLLAELPPAFGLLPSLIPRTPVTSGQGTEEKLEAKAPLGLCDRHDPKAFDQLWQRLLAVLREPVKSVDVQGLKYLLLCGAIVVRLNKDGTLDTFTWAAHKPDHPILLPFHGESVLGIPWKNDWLGYLSDLAASEIAHARASLELEIDSGIDPSQDIDALFSWRIYTAWAFGVFGCHLRHHADLRQLRQRVAHALPLDPWALHQASRTPRTHSEDAYVTVSSYNRVIRHAQAIKHINQEADHLVPLFVALCDEHDFPGRGQPMARLKRFVQSRFPQLKPRHWRSISAPSRRCWVPINDFYKGDVAKATMDLITLKCKLADARGNLPPPWLVHELLSKHGNRDHRRDQYASDFDRGALLWPWVTHLLSSIDQPTPALLKEVQGVQDWTLNAGMLPRLTQHQKRAGWPYLVKLAQAWLREESIKARSVDATWWVPFERDMVEHLTLVPLATPWHIWDEEMQMRLSLDSYQKACIDRDTVVVSVRDGQRRVATALLKWCRDSIAPRRRNVIDRGHWELDVAKGVANTEVPSRLIRSVSGWVFNAPWNKTPSAGLMQMHERRNMAQAARDDELIEESVQAITALQDRFVQPDLDLQERMIEWLNGLQKFGGLQGLHEKRVLVDKDQVRGWITPERLPDQWIRNACSAGFIGRSTVDRIHGAKDDASLLTEAERQCIDRYHVDVLLRRKELFGDSYGFWGAQQLVSQDGQHAWVIYRQTGHVHSRIDILGYCLNEEDIHAIVFRHGWTTDNVCKWSPHALPSVELNTGGTTSPVPAETFDGLSDFEVDEDGVIAAANFSATKCRREVFSVPSRFTTVASLIDAIEDCPPLAEAFRSLAIEERSEIEWQLEDDDSDLSKAERRRLQAILDALDENGEGWDNWLRLSGLDRLPEFTQVVNDWLDEEIDWNEQEYFDDFADGQSATHGYFDRLDFESLRALGVAIIDGDHPGSNYRAAGLRKAIDEANEIALVRGLTCRFRKKS